MLAATANPEAPNEVDVSQPSAALTAEADAQGAFNDLFLGLGAVALLVGAVGVANIMVISVLERRSEIGLRRALGATKGHIRLQFLSEAVLLSVIGGVTGIAFGAISTAVYASTKGWAIVVPPLAWGGGFGAAVLIGAVAGPLPSPSCRPHVPDPGALEHLSSSLLAMPVHGPPLLAHLVLAAGATSGLPPRAGTTVVGRCGHRVCHGVGRVVEGCRSARQGHAPHRR